MSSSLCLLGLPFFLFLASVSTSSFSLISFEISVVLVAGRAFVSVARGL